MAGTGQAYKLRELSKEVRELTLKEIKAVLLDIKGESYGTEFRKQVILKLASNVLPRLNEVTGEDGEALQVVIKRANDSEGTTTIQQAGSGDILSPAL